MFFSKRNKEASVFYSTAAAARSLRHGFGGEANTDLILKSFVSADGRELLLACVNGMTDEARIDEFILKPLMGSFCNGLSAEQIARRYIEVSEVSFERDIEKALSSVAAGMSALFLEGGSECILVETRGFEKRAVSEAMNESVVLGPKESFAENLRTNITLVRRMIKRPRLIAEMLELAENTPAALMYVDGETDPELLDQIRARLARIPSGVLLTNGTVEQLIEDRSLLPLPRILSTERPDRAASHILNGRAALLIDGSPFALVMPVTLFSLMNSPEDVYLRPPLGSVLRFVRYLGALISVLMPGYFLALALYHQGMLTTEVLSTVIASRKMVFEPITVEMILLLVIFQLIREAGMRVPGPIGQAIGIIGGLIMGQAAVTAHLASSVVLIIVAASGLGNFCIPDYSTQLAASYFRIAGVAAARLGGLLGLSAAGLFALCELADTESFGTPYLEPLSPCEKSKRPKLFRGKIGNTGGAGEGRS